MVLGRRLPQIRRARIGFSASVSRGEFKCPLDTLGLPCCKERTGGWGGGGCVGGSIRCFVNAGAACAIDRRRDPISLDPLQSGVPRPVQLSRDYHWDRAQPFETVSPRCSRCDATEPCARFHRIISAVPTSTRLDAAPIKWRIAMDV